MIDEYGPHPRYGHVGYRPPGEAVINDALFVAEIKTHDPWRDRASKYTFDHLLELAAEFGDVISLHTNTAFTEGLSFHYQLERVRASAPDTPILAKGTHMLGFESEQWFKAGATHVLTCNPDVRTWSQEPQSEELWYEIPRRDANLIAPEWPIVVNGRSLARGTMDEYALSHLTGLVGNGRKVVQASLIERFEDIQPGVWAFIVGTKLPELVATL